MEKEQKFYLGLDIGTNSVGIACTDENYNLLRVKGKDCWAVRLFDEAQTAADRRTARTARRRLQRRRYRINQLQGLFAPFMQDNLFFLRLNNSQFFCRRQGRRTGRRRQQPVCRQSFYRQEFSRKVPDNLPFAFCFAAVTGRRHQAVLPCASPHNQVPRTLSVRR